MKKAKNRTMRLDGSCFMGHESRSYQEDMVLTFRKQSDTEVQTAIIELDLYDLQQLVGRVHQHVAFQQSKLDNLRKALRGDA